jgi:hypothetical protein
MNPLEMAKAVYEAIEKYNDVALMKQVVELAGGVKVGVSVGQQLLTEFLMRRYGLK